MNKLQELTNSKEELQTKMAQMWDELMEVNEYISAIEESGKVKKIFSKQQVSLPQPEHLKMFDNYSLSTTKKGMPHAYPFSMQISLT